MFASIVGPEGSGARVHPCPLEPNRSLLANWCPGAVQIAALSPEFSATSGRREAARPVAARALAAF